MIGFLLYYACGFGLAQWVPGMRPAYAFLPGLRYLLGVLLIAPAFYFAHVVVGLSLNVSAHGIAAVAVAGLVFWIRDWASCPVARIPFTHPLLILVAVVSAAVIYNGGVGYVPYLSDEFSSWNMVAKQAYALDGFRPEEMVHGSKGYTPGWPLFLLFPQMFLDRFDDDAVALVPVALHIGLLGLVFDVARVALARIGGFEARPAAVYAWMFVLIALIVEVNGQLVARNLLIEPPQIYTLSVISVLVLALTVPGSDRRPLSLAIGMVFACAYLLKVACLTYAPALFMLSLFLAVRGEKSEEKTAWPKSLVDFGLRLLLPGLLVYVTWQFNMTESSLMGSPIQTFSSNAILKISAANALETLGIISTGVGRYLASYKVPLSLVAGLGMVVALRSPSRRIVTVIFLVFAAVYLLGLCWYYIAVFNTNSLFSIERYTRVPLRVFHLTGLMLLLVEAAAAIAQQGKVARIWLFATSRPALLGAGFTIAVLGVVQVWLAERRIEDLTTRRYQYTKPYLLKLPSEVEKLFSLMKERVDEEPKIIVIIQGSENGGFKLAYYYLTPTKQGAGIGGINLEPTVSWGPEPVNPAMKRSDGSELPALFQNADVIWPIVLDDWMRAQLAPLIPDPACRADPGAYFLFPVKRETVVLSCVAKTSS